MFRTTSFPAVSRVGLSSSVSSTRNLMCDHGFTTLVLMLVTFIGLERPGLYQGGGDSRTLTADAGPALRISARAEFAHLVLDHLPFAVGNVVRLEAAELHGTFRTSYRNISVTRLASSSGRVTQVTAVHSTCPFAIKAFEQGGAPQGTKLGIGRFSQSSVTQRIDAGSRGHTFDAPTSRRLAPSVALRL